MTVNIKKIHPLRLVVVIFFSAALFAACNNGVKEVKPAEEKTVEAKKDSLPPIDKKDSVTTTAPETIKNTPSGN
jgi:hypothetical protein